MVVFLLRHADRNSDMDSLSPAGMKRARFLAHMLAGSGVRVAYCSDALRTQETLAPLRQALGDALTINEISAASPGGPDGHVQALVAAVDALPADRVAVVVSHSNTVGPIIQGLGGGIIPAIEDTEFDKLFVLFRPAGGQKTLLQLRY